MECGCQFWTNHSGSSGGVFCCCCAGDGHDAYTEKVPTAVWTGSFNLTYNGERSLENVVIIQDEHVARRYAEEWAWVLSLSESLDWTQPWVAPEYRWES